jgi:hypothetical protein
MLSIFLVKKQKSHNIVIDIYMYMKFMTDQDKHGLIYIVFNISILEECYLTLHGLQYLVSLAVLELVSYGLYLYEDWYLL